MAQDWDIKIPYHKPRHKNQNTKKLPIILNATLCSHFVLFWIDEFSNYGNWSFSSHWKFVKTTFDIRELTEAFSEQQIFFAS